MWLSFALLRLASLFPYPVLLKIGAGLGQILQKLSAKRRRVIDINLKLCFPDKTPQQRELIKNESYKKKTKCYSNGINIIKIYISSSHSSLLAF